MREKYCVSFGGHRFEFNNHKRAVAFVASLNRYCTRLLVELNDIYKRLFVQYRDDQFYWFQQQKEKSDFETNRKCSAALKLFDEVFENTFWQSNYESGAYYTCANLCKLIITLKDAAFILKASNHYRKQTATVYRLQNIIIQLNQIEFDVKNYEAEKAASVISEDQPAIIHSITKMA